MCSCIPSLDIRSEVPAETPRQVVGPILAVCYPGIALMMSYLDLAWWQ